MAKFIIKGHFGQAVNCRNAVSEQKNKELIKRLNELTLREPDPAYIPPPSVYTPDFQSDYDKKTDIDLDSQTRE